MNGDFRTGLFCIWYLYRFRKFKILDCVEMSNYSIGISFSIFLVSGVPLHAFTQRKCLEAPLAVFSM